MSVEEFVQTWIENVLKERGLSEPVIAESASSYSVVNDGMLIIILGWEWAVQKLRTQLTGIHMSMPADLAQSMKYTSVLRELANALKKFETNFNKFAEKASRLVTSGGNAQEQKVFKLAVKYFMRLAKLWKIVEENITKFNEYLEQIGFQTRLDFDPTRNTADETEH